MLYSLKKLIKASASQARTITMSDIYIADGHFLVLRNLLSLEDQARASAEGPFPQINNVRKLTDAEFENLLPSTNSGTSYKRTPMIIETSRGILISIYQSSAGVVKIFNRQILKALGDPTDICMSPKSHIGRSCISGGWIMPMRAPDLLDEIKAIAKVFVGQKKILPRIRG